jgi:hypothetical protein
MCINDQKTIDTSPVSGSAKLTLFGEVLLFSDLFTHFVKSSLLMRSVGILAPYTNHDKKTALHKVTYSAHRVADELSMNPPHQSYTFI